MSSKTCHCCERFESFAQNPLSLHTQKVRGTSRITGHFIIDRNWQKCWPGGHDFTRIEITREIPPTYGPNLRTTHITDRHVRISKPLHQVAHGGARRQALHSLRWRCRRSRIRSAVGLGGGKASEGEGAGGEWGNAFPQNLPWPPPLAPILLPNEFCLKRTGLLQRRLGATQCPILPQDFEVHGFQLYDHT